MPIPVCKIASVVENLNIPKVMEFGIVKCTQKLMCPFDEKKQYKCPAEFSSDGCNINTYEKVPLFKFEHVINLMTSKGIITKESVLCSGDSVYCTVCNTVVGIIWRNSVLIALFVRKQAPTSCFFWDGPLQNLTPQQQQQGVVGLLPFQQFLRTEQELREILPPLIRPNQLPFLTEDFWKQTTPTIEKKALKAFFKYIHWQKEDEPCLLESADFAMVSFHSFFEN